MPLFQSPSPQDYTLNIFYSGIPETANRWDWSSVDEDRWSLLFPYQIMVLKATTDSSGKETYSQGSTFTLPINPESLNNSMPFATILQATFGGVVEYNGGVPIRHIEFTGNFGVINGRGLVDYSSGPPASAIPGGIIVGNDNSTSMLSGLNNTAQSNSLYKNPYGGGAGFLQTQEEVPERTTGYYQWLFLQRFLEGYAELKTRQAGDKYRLGLAIWKDQAVYLVSPQMFQVNRSINAPMEYSYSLSFKAYARINPKSIKGNEAVLKVVDDPVSLFEKINQFFKAVISTITNALKLVTRFLNFINSLVAGVLQLVEEVKSVILMVKNIVGLVKTIVDFPNELMHEIKSTLQSLADAVKISNIFDTPSKLPKLAPSSISKFNSRNTASNTSNSSYGTFEPFTIPNFNGQITVDTPINGLPLPKNLIDAINRQITKVSSFTNTDLDNIRNNVDSLAKLYSSLLGLGDPKNSGSTIKARDPLDEDFQILNSFYSISNAISQLIVYNQYQYPSQTSLLDYVAGLGAVDGINIRRAKSKFAVPFPFGSSLEQVAMRYLGDPNRWVEIAALNELTAPYIDETGSTIQLLTNGIGNTVAVSDIGSISINHSINISSNTQKTQNRMVTNISKIDNSYYQLTLSGDNNLNLFTLSDGAYIQYYAPNTVNSQKMIFIPSDQTTINNYNLRYVPTIQDLQQILQVGGVDGALTDSLDIQINSSGDWPYIQGTQNLVQWARLALSTSIGSWLTYPHFGIDVSVGESLADMSAADIISSIKNTFIYNSAFNGVASALVNVQGPVTSIVLDLSIKGVDSTIPVSFQVAQ